MGQTAIEWTATQNPDGTWSPGKTWNPVVGALITTARKRSGEPATRAALMRLANAFASVRLRGDEVKIFVMFVRVALSMGGQKRTKEDTASPIANYFSDSPARCRSRSGGSSEPTPCCRMSTTKRAASSSGTKRVRVSSPATQDTSTSPLEADCGLLRDTQTTPGNEIEDIASVRRCAG